MSLRIAYIIPSFEPSLGGEQRDAFDSASGLARLGCRVSVFTAALPKSVPENIDLVLLHSRSLSRTSRHLNFTRLAREALQQCGPWDIVQSFCRIPLGNVYRAGGGTHLSFLRTMRRFEGPLSSLIAAASPKSRYYHKLEAANYVRKGVLFLANSRRTASELMRDFSVPAESISVLYPAVDLARFHPAARKAERQQIRSELGISDSDFAVAFLGSGFRRKGLSRLLQICAGLKNCGIAVKLLVAGKDGCGIWRRQAQACGISDHVIFLGPQQDAMRVLAPSDLLALPSLYEPFGLAPLEAMACAIPVLASEDCGIAEILRDGREGFLISARDPLRAAVARAAMLAQDGSLRERMGLSGRRTAETMGVEIYCRRLLSCYSEICGSFSPAVSTIAV